MSESWRFKENLEPQGSSNGFWYDIAYGGYIDPKEILEDKEQLKGIEYAIELLKNFEMSLEAEGLIEEF